MNFGLIQRNYAIFFMSISVELNCMTVIIKNF